MKKERRSEAVIITASQIDLAGHYLQLRRLRQMVQEAERLRAERRPRYARRRPFAVVESSKEISTVN
jgi:hypothetical protein